jgi:threonine synthase
VESVNEQEIADAKAIIGRDGIGCEPASAVTLAGIKKMVAAGRLDPGEDLLALLTGHVLKDPDYTVYYHQGALRFEDKNLSPRYANQIVRVSADRQAILAHLFNHLH